MSISSCLTTGLALLIVLGCVSNADAQKKNPFANNIIGTLANKKLVGELELLDEQKENIDQLMKEFGQVRREVGEDMKDRWEAAGDAEREELGKEYWRRIEESRLEIVKEMKDNLLPHQIQRLEQLSAQRKMNEGKGRESAGLLSDQMISYLEINDAQRQKIQEKSEKLKKEVGEKIRKILEEAKQDLLGELTLQQKKKYEDLLGEPAAEQSGNSDRGEKKEKDRRRSGRR